MKEYIRNLTILLVFIQFTSCKDYYNDTIQWMDSIDIGTHIRIVKDNQPDFVIIDWENPQQFSLEEKRYLVTDIKGNHDLLNMTHFLIFIDNKFEYRSSHK